MKTMKTLKYASLISLLLAGLLLAGAATPAMAIQSAPTNQVNATIVEDFHCATTPANRQICGTTKTDGNSLRLQANLSLEPTYVAILRYNVATPGDWVIAKARLNMAYGYAGSCTAATVAIKVYETANGDADPPQRGDFLVDVNATAPSLPGIAQVPNSDPNAISEAYQHWTDTTAGDGLAGYLNAERTNDGVATLWVEETTYSTGSVFFAASNDNGVALNNSCGVGAGGAYVLQGPVLQLSDMDQPLSVDISNFDSAAAPTWPFYAGLGALALLAVVGVKLSQRRAAR